MENPPSLSSRSQMSVSTPHCMSLIHSSRSSQLQLLPPTPKSLAAIAAAAVAASVPLLNLCESLYDRSADTLQVKINRYLEMQTQASTACLILVSEDEELFFCQVIGGKKLTDEIKFPSSSTNLSTMLRRKINCFLTENDFPKDQLKSLSEHLGIPIRSLLTVPVLNPGRQDHTILVACLLNKRESKHFTEADAALIHECFRYTRSILLNTLAFEEERRIKIQCQSLLTVAKNLFTHLDDVTLLLKEIMAEARHLTKAERCSLFLLDHEHNELVAKVFDGHIPENGTENGNMEVRIPFGQGIAGQVAMTGELLNIRDAYSHPLFYKEMDRATGFKTRNILCFPIRDEKGVIGIAELCNKVNGLYFTTFDEEIAMAFAVYCGISIMHSLMWKKVRDAHNRSKLSNELMMYHMQVTAEDVKKLSKMRIPEPGEIHQDFRKFLCVPRNLPEYDTPMIVISMMEDMGMLSRWRIHRETLSRFVLMVRKGYRDPPYHNWLHAFSVAHFCYLMIKNMKLIERGCLSSLECLSLFVACLCHDLDHRGTTSSFQVASKSVLAALYSSEGSVMERHHFAQAMCILNTEGCNVFENLSRKDYTKCLDIIRDTILATDVAQHLRHLDQVKEMASNGYDKSNPKHHSLLLCLLVTASDLSDQTKDFRSAKKIAELVYREFFSQGDLEKAMGQHPLQMMDREKAFIPELQINFISHIALPVYQILTEMFPEAACTAKAVESNLTYWQRLQDVYKQRHSNNMTSSLDIFEDEDLDHEVLNGLSNSGDGTQLNHVQ